MQKARLIQELVCNPKFEGSDYDRSFLQGVLVKIDDESLLQSLVIALKLDSKNLCFNGVYRLKEVLGYLKECLKEYAAQKAENGRVKDYQGSRLQEKELLKAHIFNTLSKELGLKEWKI